MNTCRSVKETWPLSHGGKRASAQSESVATVTAVTNEVRERVGAPEEGDWTVACGFSMCRFREIAKFDVGSNNVSKN